MENPGVEPHVLLDMDLLVKGEEQLQGRLLRVQLHLASQGQWAPLMQLGREDDTQHRRQEQLWERQVWDSGGEGCLGQ